MLPAALEAEKGSVRQSHGAIGAAVQTSWLFHARRDCAALARASERCGELLKLLPVGVVRVCVVVISA